MLLSRFLPGWLDRLDRNAVPAEELRFMAGGAERVKPAFCMSG